MKAYSRIRLPAVGPSRHAPRQAACSFFLPLAFHFRWRTNNSGMKTAAPESPLATASEEERGSIAEEELMPPLTVLYLLNVS